MKERLKQIRKDQKMTQSKFGDRLGLTKNYIYLMESGENPITDKVIYTLKKEFGVNETWLRTGNGDMYDPETKDQRIAQLVSRLYTEETNPHLQSIINVVSSMSAEQIDLLIDVARKLVAEEEKEQ